MSDPFWLISFLISACLVFFSLALVVESAISLLRVKNPRIRSLLRIYPIFHIGLDFFMSQFSIGQFLNPLSCASCLQKLILSFFPHLKSYLTENQISLTKYLASEWPHFPFTALLFLFSFATFSIFLFKIPRIATFAFWVKERINKSEICQRSLSNPQLREALDRQKVKVLVSNAIQIPMAACRKVIVMPKTLVEKFSQGEFEAVLAHELEHLRWKDPFVKVFTEVASLFFWWVPMRWWLKKLDEEQEMACDASIQRYGLEREALASALVKVANIHRQVFREPAVALCGFAYQPCSALVRLKMILDPTKIPKRKWLWLVLAGPSAGALTWVSCMMI